MKVTTYDASGKSGAQAALPEETFDGTVNQDALHQVVTAVLAHRRQGTASTKSRSTIRGGGSKPWRQKGTGRARAGSVRSALWRGGSIVFGPHPRSYSPKVPKQLRRLAIRSALNARALEGDLALVAPIELDEPKTQRVAGLLDAIGASEGNVLLLTAGTKPALYRSARNIPGVRVCPWGEASAYDVLWSDLVLIESSAFDAAPAEPAPAAPAEPVTTEGDEDGSVGSEEGDE